MLGIRGEPNPQRAHSNPSRRRPDRPASLPSSAWNPTTRERAITKIVENRCCQDGDCTYPSVLPKSSMVSTSCCLQRTRASWSAISRNAVHLLKSSPVRLLFCQTRHSVATPSPASSARGCFHDWSTPPVQHYGFQRPFPDAETPVVTLPNHGEYALPPNRLEKRDTSLRPSGRFRVARGSAGNQNSL